MGAQDEYSSDWVTEDDELVRRLRSLQWAPVPEELRQRCWEDFNGRVAERGLASNGRVASRAAFNVAERHDFRRLTGVRRLAVAERGSRTPLDTRRASLAQAATRRYVPRRAVSLTR